MTTTQAMNKIGLSRAQGGIRKRLIISVEAREKRGKTNFALTAPAPIALFDFDTGLEGVLEKFADNKEIYVGEYRRDKSQLVTKAAWEGVLEKFKKEYVAALQEPSVRTVVFDTATEAWELLRMARFGKLTQVMPNHYGPVNDEYREMIRAAFASDKNVILLHKMKAEYVASKVNPAISNPTGGWIRAGFADTPYLVQMNLRLDRDAEGFLCQVLDCRQSPFLEGLELRGEDVSFPSVAAMVFPDTDADDWR